VIPQPPQLPLTALFASHPFDATPSQFRYPEMHDATVQLEPLHPAVACGSVHMPPQPPQLFGSVAVFEQVPLQFVSAEPQPSEHA
jgi:hypothetical protein